jgi:hypothetical protein
MRIGYLFPVISQGKRLFLFENTLVVAGALVYKEEVLIY